jgi:hypothetical protein
MRARWKPSPFEYVIFMFMVSQIVCQNETNLADELIDSENYLTHVTDFALDSTTDAFELNSFFWNTTGKNDILLD